MKTKKTDKKFREAVTLLEDARAFVLRFDENDDEEIKMAKRISDFLKTIKGVQL